MAGRSSTRTASSSRQPKPKTFSDKWDLTHLVKNPARQLDALLAELEAKVVQIEAARPGLSPTMPGQDLLALLRCSEAIAEGSSRLDRKSTRLNSSHTDISRMPSSA